MYYYSFVGLEYHYYYFFIYLNNPVILFLKIITFLTFIFDFVIIASKYIYIKIIKLIIIIRKFLELFY